MIAVAEMNSFDELANLRVTWNQLWEKTRDVSFFQSWEWLRSYWRFYGEGQTLRTLVVTLGTKPVGIVPFVVRPVQTTFGTANVLTWPLDEWGAFYGQIGPNPAATMVAALKHVTSVRRDWNVIELPFIDENGLDKGRTRNALKTSKLSGRPTNAVSHPVVQLDGSWDLYMDEQPLESRVGFMRALRRLESHGTVSFHRWRPEGGSVGQTDRRWDLFKLYARIRRDASRSISQAESETTFLKDVHPWAVDAGAVEICSVCVGGRPVACAYNYRSGGKIEVLSLVSDEQFGDAATTVLAGQMIRDSFMRNDDQMLFQHADSVQVSSWANATSTAVTLSHFSMLSPQAQLLRMKRGTATVPTPVTSEATSPKNVSDSNIAADNDRLRVFAG
jgi:CelD/BcsL family acetyltransferase involved in cellulose biosynthesis